MSTGIQPAEGSISGITIAGSTGLSQAKQPEEIVRATITSIEKDAKEFEERSKILRRLQSGFVFLAIVLSVGSPILVTYFAQSPGTGALKFIVISLTALAGASTILLSTFRWGERFGHASLGMLDLQQLASYTELELNNILRKTRPESLAEDLTDLNERAASKRFVIRRRIVKSEVLVVAQQRQAIEDGSGGQDKDKKAKG